MRNIYFLYENSDRERILRKFEEKKNVAHERYHQLFDIFDSGISETEDAALKFTYAYMPINDLGDCSGDFFLKHVRDMFEIRRKVPWGSKVPDKIFCHFVLPYRVNNENVEDHTQIFFNELFDRVKELSMYDAILEVNHWCYEKATYIGCDPRTSSPLSLIRRAIGRCGEETTLAVAALRSIGIPARQAYTPKWVHCDSNHAWAEAWADGRWYYLGACEPEPRLNRGWFTNPGRRAMLINTRVPANYQGPEEITLAHEWYTELNLLENYAPCKKITVKIKYKNNRPAVGAKVYFLGYNYGDFLPIVMLTSDKDGCVYLTTGFGDLLLHAVCSGKWGSRKIDIRNSDHFVMTVSGESPVNGTVEFDMVPPAQTYGNTEEPTQNEIDKSNGQQKKDVEVRKAYEATFMNREQSDRLAARLSLPADRVWDVIEKARGNFHEMTQFLEETVPGYGATPLDLLGSLLEKDLTDISVPILKDHLLSSVKYFTLYDKDIFVKYILCPRAGFEMIGAYRDMFQKHFSDVLQNCFRQDPRDLVGWISKNIVLMEGYSYFQGTASPKGSFELRASDRPSRDILFVAVARSFGIPARLEPADKRPQFMSGSEWTDAVFDTSAVNNEKAGFGRIRLIKEPGPAEKSGYNLNFTLARFTDNMFKTLDYKKTDLSEFERSIEVPAGIYRLVTGTRINDGSVLVRTVTFEVVPEKISEVQIGFRKEEGSYPVIGTVPGDTGFMIRGNKDKTPVGELSGKGLAVIWIEPDREPSKHLLRELRELGSELDPLGCSIVICIGDEKMAYSFNDKIKEGMPPNTDLCADESYAALASVASTIKSPMKCDLPHAYVVDSKLGIRYESHGYKLGTGKEILKALTALKNQ
jgi:hypothetical protein